MPQYAATLDTVIRSADQLKEVRKADLRPGDWICLKTLNSIYYMRKLANGQYEVSGGWFDRKMLSPVTTTITGCTWGSSVINIGIIAACGMCVEFGNRLTTSPVQAVVIMPECCLN